MIQHTQCQPNGMQMTNYIYLATIYPYIRLFVDWIVLVKIKHLWCSIHRSCVLGELQQESDNSTGRDHKISILTQVVGYVCYNFHIIMKRKNSLSETSTIVGGWLTLRTPDLCKIIENTEITRQIDTCLVFHSAALYRCPRVIWVVCCGRGTTEVAQPDIPFTAQQEILHLQTQANWLLPPSITAINRMWKFYRGSWSHFLHSDFIGSKCLDIYRNHAIGLD